MRQWNNRGRDINQLKTLALDKARDNIVQIDMVSVSKPIKTAINSKPIKIPLFASDMEHMKMRKQDHSCNTFVEGAKREYMTGN